MHRNESVVTRVSVKPKRGEGVEWTRVGDGLWLGEVMRRVRSKSEDTLNNCITLS